MSKCTLSQKLQQPGSEIDKLATLSDYDKGCNPCAFCEDQPAKYKIVISGQDYLVCEAGVESADII